MNICVLTHFTNEESESQDKQLSQDHPANEGGSNAAMLKVKCVPGTCHLSPSRRSTIWMVTGAQATAGTNMAHLLNVPLHLLTCFHDF